MNDAPSELELTAFHESGHCVLAHLRGMTVVHASVVAEPGALGSVHTKQTRPGRKAPLASPARRAGVLGYIEMCLAGPVAQARRLLTTNHEAPTVEVVMDCFHDNTGRSQTDLKDAVIAAKAVSFSREEAKHLVKHLTLRAAGRMVHSDKIWLGVTAVAMALLEHGELDGGHVHWVLRAVLAGRSYYELRHQLAARVNSATWSRVPPRLSRAAARLGA